MKVFIYSKLKDGAWGGGNQFLKALRNEFKKEGILADSSTDADSVLFNGYQDARSLISFYFRRKNKKIIFRLGPVLHLHRGIKWYLVDFYVICCANLFADLVVFQSNWSYQEACKLGLSKRKKYTIILNAVDEKIFFPKPNMPANQNMPVRLVYASWSANQNKGFSYLSCLDNQLDFTKYQMTFIGNSPRTFKNIHIFPPVSSEELAGTLRESDIFISPTKDDACSNAILEALTCGLPVVALASGGNSELIRTGGMLFHNEQEMMSRIEEVSSTLKHFQDAISIKNIQTISHEYMNAINGTSI